MDGAIVFILVIVLAALWLVTVGLWWLFIELDDAPLKCVGVLLGWAAFSVLPRSMMTVVDGNPQRAPSPRRRGRRP